MRLHQASEMLGRDFSDLEPFFIDSGDSRSDVGGVDASSKQRHISRDTDAGIPQPRGIEMRSNQEGVTFPGFDIVDDLLRRQFVAGKWRNKVSLPIKKRGCQHPAEIGSPDTFVLGAIMKESDPGKAGLDESLTKTKGVSKVIRYHESHFHSLERLANFYDRIVLPVEVQFRRRAEGRKQQDSLRSRESQLAPELPLIRPIIATPKFFDEISHSIGLGFCPEIKV